MYKAIVVLHLLLLSHACGGGGTSPQNREAQDENIPLNTRSWELLPATPTQIGIDNQVVEDILSYVLTDSAVQSVVILKNGWKIGERYAEGYDANDFGTSWSMAKSFYSAAIGVAISEGWISSVDQKASTFLTEWIGTNKEDITIRNILEMRSGLSGGNHGGTEIVYTVDQTDYAISRELTGIPGETWAYSNPTSQLFAPIIERSTGLDAHTYLSQKILIPIDVDINEVGLWLDPTGENPITYCCIDMKPDDFARFGLLYARDGEWEGNQIIPEDYFAASTTVQWYFYGYQWWVLNSAFLGEEVAHDEMFAAIGYHGQNIWVWPEQDVVIVILSIYEHSRNAGYVLSAADEDDLLTNANFPNTCTARNDCSWSEGSPIPSFDNLTLWNLIQGLADR